MGCGQKLSEKEIFVGFFGNDTQKREDLSGKFLEQVRHGGIDRKPVGTECVNVSEEFLRHFARRVDAVLGSHAHQQVGDGRHEVQREFAKVFLRWAVLEFANESQDELFIDEAEESDDCEASVVRQVFDTLWI